MDKKLLSIKKSPSKAYLAIKELLLLP